MAVRWPARRGEIVAGGATQLTGLTDVSVAAITSGFVLVANGTTYAGRALVEADISDLGTYEPVDATIVRTTDAAWNATDWDTAFGWGDHGAASYLTAVVAGDVNAEASTDGWVLTSDGAGNTAWEAIVAASISAGASTDGQVLTSDGAGTTAWEDAAGGSQTPWTSDIDGGGFGLDNIDRLEIQAPGIATDTLTMTHDGTDFDFTFANTNFADFSGATAVRYIGTRLDFSNATQDFASHFHLGTNADSYISCANSSGFLMARQWVSGSTFIARLLLDNTDLTLDSTINLQADGGITVTDTASFSVATSGALLTDEEMTLTKSGVETIHFTGTAGPIGLTWEPGTVPSAERIHLNYRTGPKTLQFERQSDSADILTLNPADLQVTVGGTVFITERAAALADVTAKGQLWVKNTTPCELWFTDDAGTDTQIV